MAFSALEAQGAAVAVGQFNRYQGTDGVLVNSPYTGVDLDLDERTKLAMHYTLDAVSAASFNYSQGKTHRNDPSRQAGSCKTCHTGVDAISGASQMYQDNRHDVNLRVTRKIGETDVRPGYIRSEENDYVSQTIKLDLDQNLFSRNSTWSIGFRRLSDLITPVWTKNITHSLITDGASLGLTQILTRGTVVKAGVDYTQANGFQSNPYAWIQIGNQTSSPVPERHPEEKQRVDLSASLKQALPWSSALELDYRYYQDTWDVKAHTAEVGLTKDFGWLVVEPFWRYYAQNQAYFFKNFYSVQETYLSRDLKLAEFSTQMLSLSLRGELGNGWSTQFRYSHFMRQDDLDYRRYFADVAVTADLFVLGFTYQ
ncbi:MAG: DUF3570 domain-containing protein [candidate division FCPU426 bacterium]